MLLRSAGTRYFFLSISGISERSAFSQITGTRSGYLARIRSASDLRFSVVMYYNEYQRKQWKKKDMSKWNSSRENNIYTMQAGLKGSIATATHKGRLFGTFWILHWNSARAKQSWSGRRGSFNVWHKNIFSRVGVTKSRCCPFVLLHVSFSFEAKLFIESERSTCYLSAVTTHGCCFADSQ